MRNLRNNRNYADYNKKELRKNKVRDSKDKAVKLPRLVEAVDF